MKKMYIIFLTFAFVAAIATSCKTHEKCAAYTKAETEKPFVDKSLKNS